MISRNLCRLGALVAAAALAGCEPEPYCLNCTTGDGGSSGLDVGRVDSGRTDVSTTCRPTADRREVCDGFDNDCDGRVDEDFDLAKRPRAAAAACGNRCALPNAIPTCSMGVCGVRQCDVGRLRPRPRPRRRLRVPLHAARAPPRCATASTTTATASSTRASTGRPT
jgi:hypothetical protein